MDLTKAYKVDAQKGAIIGLLISGSILFLITIVSFILIIYSQISMKFLVIPILVGLLAIGLISGGIYNIYIHKRYMNCLKYGKKSNGIIINKIKHETNKYPYASLRYTYLNHKLYENNILNWFTVYVKYKGEDGNEYASFFSAPCADDVGASIPILIYKNYATWDKDSFAIPKGEKILICSCGCKLNKNDITCPSCGKEV